MPLEPIPPVDGLLSLRQAHKLVADRALMEAAARAFVAYVRAYKEHQCSYIFRLDQLDLDDLHVASRCFDCQAEGAERQAA